MPTFPRPTDPDRNRGMFGEVLDPAMEPDRGAGMAPPRDPYMASLPPAAGSGPGRSFVQQARSELVAPLEGPPDEAAFRDYSASDPSGVTKLMPSRTQPFSRADAQALRALDPRSLQEAQSIAAAPESMPAKMTGSFGGQSFEMQPSARVDRNALARLYAQGVERKMQERGDNIRAQEQTGAQALARIPGESAVNLAKQQGGDKLAAIRAEGDIQAPTRLANVRKSDAEAAALGGKEKREQGTFDLANDPAEKQRKAADEAIKMMQASGFDKTPQGRQTIAALMALSSAGSRLPEAARGELSKAVSQTSPGDELATVQEFTADPQVARLIQEIQGSKQGIIQSDERGNKQGAARRALDSYVRKYAAAKGVDAQALKDQIESQLVGTDAPATMNFNRLGQMADAVKGLVR